MRSANEPARDEPDPFAELHYGSGAPSLEPSAEPPAGWPGARRHASARRSPRLLAAALGVGALAAGGLVFAFTRGGGAAPLVSTPVTEAAYVTTRESGFKAALTIDYTIAGQTLTLSANGSFNTAPVQGSMSIVAPGGSTLSELVIGSEAYIQLPPGSAEFGAPTPWVKADMSAYTGASSGSASSVGAGGDPTQDLDFLRATGQVTTVGSESVRGVPTTHYHAVIDLNRLVAATPASESAAASREVAELERLTGQDTLPADVWVDLRGRVRRMALAMNICSKAGTITAAITIELFDYGRQPAVVPPPASEVTDVTSQLASGTAAGTAQLGC